jgi:predicted branched-subunit amino acid permease
METFFYILHMLGLVGLVVTLVISLRKPIKKLSAGTLHSAWLQLLSGLALMGIMSGDEDFHPEKFGIKLIVLVVILALGYRNVKKETVSTKFLGSILGLVLLNVVIALAV